MIFFDIGNYAGKEEVNLLHDKINGQGCINKSIKLLSAV